jgi:hypothetical protein
VRPILSRFLSLEDRVGADMLCEAAEHRRYGRRTMEFNCFDVLIDGDAGTVTVEEIIGDDGMREVIPTDELLRELRESPD